MADAEYQWILESIAFFITSRASLLAVFPRSNRIQARPPRAATVRTPSEDMSSAQALRDEDTSRYLGTDFAVTGTLWRSRRPKSSRRGQRHAKKLREGKKAARARMRRCEELSPRYRYPDRDSHARERRLRAKERDLKAAGDAYF